MVRLVGIEPTHPAPEAGALSTELQAQRLEYERKYSILLKKVSIKRRLEDCSVKNKKPPKKVADF